MKHLPALGLVALFLLLGACTGGSYTNQSYYSECESRGLASGSAGYSRCVSAPSQRPPDILTRRGA